MKAAHINYSGMNLDYKMASGLAATFADKDPNIIDPVMVAWHDKQGARMSPAIEGADVNTRWHDYGESHGGKLEGDVNGEFDFIFADSSAFEPYGPSPYINLHDQHGNEYLCQINALRDPHDPSKEACVVLDDWTSKLT
ncbi:MAG: AF1514 family protein [Sulfurimicrobium sp.]|jgi:hypothetical protein|nr:AF1514 family protein [Sulfurimicrobium sp.]MDO9190929.1 AF1514 family protein [Sulfurimicrobium sp.]MDP1705188.1 AF1514 family protein [Sulfurimicrobium sp.]MDP2198226.1 AF1514 family protein [Sulfurimicrobium sp.]MDP3687974.1 AF1514 family protein [Sulfurimicrobium sp.]